MAKQVKQTKKTVSSKKKSDLYIERCMSEGGARVMIKYLTETLGHEIVSLETPRPNEDHWYVITYRKVAQ